jgi:hypothetical protein
VTAATLLQDLLRLGVQAAVEGAGLVLDGNTENLTPELLAELRQHKSALLDLLRARQASPKRPPEYAAALAVVWAQHLAPGVRVRLEAFAAELYVDVCRELGAAPLSLEWLDAFLLERAPELLEERPLQCLAAPTGGSLQ